MRNEKVYMGLALAISIFFGIILPLTFGIRDLQLVAIIFSSIWLVFLAGYFVNTLMIKGRRNLKKRLKEGINDKWGYS